MVLGEGGLFGILGSPLLDVLMVWTFSLMLSVVLVPVARVSAAIEPANIADPVRRADIGCCFSSCK